MLTSVTPMDRRRLLPAVGLGILLVVDLVLVVWALWPTSVPTAPTSTDAVASVSAPASPSRPPLDGLALLVGVGDAVAQRLAEHERHRLCPDRYP